MIDCAFKRGRYCTALRTKYCKGCSFRKTQLELQAGRAAARERINSLPLAKQDYIYDKYHSGREETEE